MSLEWDESELLNMEKLFKKVKQKLEAGQALPKDIAKDVEELHEAGSLQRSRERFRIAWCSTKPSAVCLDCTIIALESYLVTSTIRTFLDVWVV